MMQENDLVSASTSKSKIRRQKKQRNAFQSKISMWYRKQDDKLPVLYSILWWMGLLGDSDKTLARRLQVRAVSAVFVMVTADIMTIALFATMANTSVLYIMLIYMIIHIFGILTYIVLRGNRKTLTNLLGVFHEIRPDVQLKRTNIFFYHLLFVNGVAITMEALSKQKADTATFLAYQISIEMQNLQLFIIICKFTLYRTFFSLFPSIMMFLLCFLSHHFCYCISELTCEVSKYSPQDFSPSKQAYILSQKRRIDDALHSLQKVFYLPSFFMCSAYFCNCCVEVHWIVKSYNYSVDFEYCIVTIINLAYSAGPLLACFWTVGGLTVETEKFMDEFRKKLQQRNNANLAVENTGTDKHLLEQTPFVLTGCDIIFFHRSSILTLGASLLTYILLLSH